MSKSYTTITDAAEQYVAPLLAPHAEDYNTETIARETFAYSRAQKGYVLIADDERYAYVVGQCAFMDDEDAIHTRKAESAWYGDPDEY